MRRQRPLNRVIERAGFETDVSVLDGVEDFERAVGDGHPIRSSIDLSEGSHPTGLLYGYLVESPSPVVEHRLGLPHVGGVGGAARGPLGRALGGAFTAERQLRR